MGKREWPEKSEFVVCSVKKVLDFGAYVELDEYDNKEGLIHVSEVASGWVKHIRDHVKEGQKIVCKVLNVNVKKRHIDLSLKDVNEHQKREKIQEWKNEQKAKKWLEFITKTLKIDDKELDNLIDLFYDKFGSSYACFEKAMLKGIDPLLKAGIDEKTADMIVKVANENLKKPHVEISGFIDLTSPLPDGIEHIKKALKKGMISDNEDIKMEIKYVGAPRYRIHVIAPDYKKAENILKKSAQAIIKSIEKSGGTGKFYRHNEKK